MKRVSLTLLAAVTIGNAAAAQDFESSQLSFDIYRYDQDGDYNSTFATVQGDASYFLSGQIGTQIGISGTTQMAKSDGFPDIDTEYALSVHGFYDLNRATRLGLLIGTDTADGTDTLFALEGIYLADGFRLEGRLGQADEATLVQAKVNAAISGRFGGQASFKRVDYGDGDGYFSVASLGATYDLNDAMSGYVTFGSTTNDFGGGVSDDGTRLGIGGTIAFGGGLNPKLFTYNPGY